MRKFIVLLLVLLLIPILAGIYGIIHDEFSYTISHEYYTKFKFYQFGLADAGNEALLPNPRLAVALVGFKATWWTGIIIGLGLGFTGLIQKNDKMMLNVILKALLVTLAITILTGLAGLCYGRFYLSDTIVNWKLPVDLVDRKSFITVGTMHNFSYMGGVLGLIAGMIYETVKAIQSRPYKLRQASHK